MSQDRTFGKRKDISPLRLILVLAISIYIVEMGVMFLLGNIPNLSPLLSTFLDSTLLVIFVSPALYYFLFHPLEKSIRDSRAMADRVLHLTYLPEDDPDPIFEIDLKAQKINYSNQSAKEQFPELQLAAGDVAVDWNHPLLSSIKQMANELMLDDKATALDVMEAPIGERGSDSYRVYDRKLRYIPNVNILRIYTVDITRQEKLAAVTQHLLAEVRQIKTELENEHKEAEEIGKSLLADQPRGGGLSAIVHTEPCSKAGGDRAGFLTRIVPGNERTEEWLMVLDASGHGRGAAKFQEVAIGSLLTLIGMGLKMEDALKSVNSTLERLGTGRFLVGNAFRLMHQDEKPAEEGFRWVEEFNLAQHAIIALDPAKDEVDEWEWDRDGGMGSTFPMGLFENGFANIQPTLRKLRNGSRIVVFTDGITEAVNTNDVAFGRERLKDVITQTRDFSPRIAHLEIVRAVKCWVGNLAESAGDDQMETVQMDDDITLAIVDVE